MCYIIPQRVKTQNSAGSLRIRHGHFGQKDEGEYKNSGPFIQRELVNSLAFKPLLPSSAGFNFDST